MASRQQQGRSREPKTTVPVFLGMAAGPLIVVTLIVVALISKVDTAVTGAIVSQRHHAKLHDALWWVGFVVGLGFTIYTVWRLHAQHQASTRSRIQTLGELLALTPTQFEHAVASLLRETGYRNVKVVGKAGDKGADIAARDAYGVAVIVQCKRHAPGRSVGAPEVQMLLGAVAQGLHGGTRGILVTTAEFSGPAREMARAHRVELMDGSSLTAMFARRDQESGAISSAQSAPKLAAG